MNGYCSRVGGKVRGWAKLCTCLMGNAWLITWRSFANLACYISFDKALLYQLCLVLVVLPWIHKRKCLEDIVLLQGIKFM